eukprot:TRINITY_DN11743_c0_g1_i1.p1 TRINITY_DN11743_c0_g1~~TRINITY_DN11743_c0_g1_i1.p1  ORF type:complete len:186 (-),score=29.79 TRINITY_DN11743_c0_g1_i1:207-764(-)
MCCHPRIYWYLLSICSVALVICVYQIRATIMNDGPSDNIFHTTILPLISMVLISLLAISGVVVGRSNKGDVLQLTRRSDGVAQAVSLCGLVVTIGGLLFSWTSVLFGLRRRGTSSDKGSGCLDDCSTYFLLAFPLFILFMLLFFFSSVIIVRMVYCPPKEKERNSNGGPETTNQSSRWCCGDVVM